MPDEEMNEAGAAEGAGEPGADEREALRRLEEEIGRLSVADHLLLMMHSLSSLAIDRLGVTSETAVRKDLDQARLAIDAFRALLGLLEGKRPAQEIAAHRAALSQLQMAYVAALGPAPANEGGGDTP
jgi:Domain of unknown function (DUF1844)